MNIEMGKQDTEYACFIMYIFVDQGSVVEHVIKLII